MCIDGVKVSPASRSMQSDKMMNNSKSEGGLRTYRIAGGCMVSRPPLFSADGSLIFVIWDKTVRAFSVATGEFVRDYEGADTNMVGIITDRNARKFLYGCSSDGVIYCWKIETGMLEERREIVPNKKN